MAEYSREYFLDQLREFWELCGRRSFWEASAAVQNNAVKALGYVFLRTPDADESLFHAALENYTRRVGLVLPAPNNEVKQVD